MAPTGSRRPPPSLRNALEQSFFVSEDRRLIENLRALKELQDTKQALSAVSGITNDQVLTRLVALGTTPETVAALAVVPLVMVAWADGEVDDKERRTILEGLEQVGVAAGGVEHQLVECWLARRPEAKLVEAWRHHVQGLCERMTEAERVAFRDDVLRSARGVAEASGGIAGLFRVSASERDVLDQLEAAFSG